MSAPLPGPSDRAAGEGDLLRRYARTRDESLREEIVARFMPLARSLAMRYAGGSEDPEDLIQIASMGLVLAVERFDPDRGLPFPAYAAPTILGELRRHFRDRLWSVRIPRGLQERVQAIDRATGELSAKLGRSPTVREVAERLEISLEEVLEGMGAGEARSTVSLDQPASLGDPEQTPLSERTGSEDRGYEAVEARSTIARGLSYLRDIEIEVLRMRFAEELTQAEIAERIGYSQMHVSRILRRALERLRPAVEP